MQTPISTEIWKVLIEMPFDSNRKRMSVLVKKENDKNDENIYLLTKGADSSLMDLINLPYDNKMLIKGNNCFSIKEHLKAFAQEGLRTLVLAKKKLNKEESEKIFKNFQEISHSVTKNKEKNLSSFFQEIERDFEYVGSAAIEDKLQEVMFKSTQGVPDTIQSLLSANIRVWVLTGDKKV
jgi:magnesium-transporting ATPase (P-type)